LKMCDQISDPQLKIAFVHWTILTLMFDQLTVKLITKFMRQRAGYICKLLEL